jgi:hypothetical protein
MTDDREGHTKVQSRPERLAESAKNSGFNGKKPAGAWPPANFFRRRKCLKNKRYWLFGAACAF